MNWRPWRRQIERRSYTSIITQALESATVETSAARGTSAAVEVAAGLLGRELMSATVEAVPWAKRAVTRDMLAWMGRTAVREGEAVAAIVMFGDRAALIPLSDHEWHSQSIDEEQWTVRGTMSAPDSTVTRSFPRESTVYLRWSLDAIERHRGRGPVSLAGGAATLAQRAEQRLGDEANAPTAHLLPIPEGHDNAGDDEGDPLSATKAAIAKAKGAAVLLESVAGGFGDASSKPGGDWTDRKIGADPDPALVMAAKDAYHRMLSVCGVPPALVNEGSAGTALREAIRHFRMLTVEPFCRCLEDELTMRLETPVRLRLDSYALDMVGRSQVVRNLTGAGVSLDVALAAVGATD